VSRFPGGAARALPPATLPPELERLAHTTNRKTRRFDKIHVEEFSSFKDALSESC